VHTTAGVVHQVGNLSSLGSSNAISLDYMKDHAESIMKASLVGYVRDAKLRGSLLDSKSAGGQVSSVDTGFFVDREEPLEALKRVRKSMDWPLGESLDGHEFLLVLQARRLYRSRSGSVRQSGES